MFAKVNRSRRQKRYIHEIVSLVLTDFAHEVRAKGIQEHQRPPSQLSSSHSPLISAPEIENNGI